MGKGRDKKKKKNNSKQKPIKSKPEKTKPLENIDELLNEFTTHHQSLYKSIEEINCAPPSRRANCSLSVNPIDANELVLFGGEFYDGKRVYMYNDLYKYNIEKNQWKKISCPTMPGPRSSHQTIITPRGMLYLFGGEFVSPNETNFFHYKDFWRFDMSLNQWEKLECSKPGPRSGHRMVFWKDYIVLFGGFFDQSQKTTYYNDLWVFDTGNMEWKEFKFVEQVPSPRSGFQFILHNDLAFLYGGYSKISKGQKTVGVMHTDAWTLKLSNTPIVQLKWEKKKKIGGILPGQRSGNTMVYHKGKGIQFGGVTDLIENEETIESIVHGDLFQYNFETNKFYPMNIKNDLLIPCPRYNPCLVISKNVMYMFGGILEVENKEITLCDFWSLNLDKLQEWKRIIADENAVLDWQGVDSDEESLESQIEDEDETEDEESIEVDHNSTDDLSDIEEPNLDILKINEKYEKIRHEQELRQSQMTTSEMDLQAENDPQPGESMADYFCRTTDYWQSEAHKEFDRTGKVLRRRAFYQAYDRYLYMRPSNELVEMEMKENKEKLEPRKPNEQEPRNRNR
jgi:N-acetylneuraminic acid mutarotase